VVAIDEPDAQRAAGNGKGACRQDSWRNPRGRKSLSGVGGENSPNALALRF
jgi:hypothetical protein